MSESGPKAKEQGMLCLKESPRLEAKRYVLLISGTMNPPHRGHVRLGLSAKKALEESGHVVEAICFVPVHDNYMINKQKVAAASSTSQAKRATPSAADMFFPSARRCELMQALVDEEGADAKACCHVLNYELEQGSELLEESPNYWAPKLPAGYLRTVPTTALIDHFATKSGFVKEGVRLAVVFGVDNLAGMSSWNNPERLLARADLVLVAREAAAVSFGRDPAALFSALRHFDVRATVDVSFQGQKLFGSQTGSFLNEKAAPGVQAALILLPALEGEDETLSSTDIRNSVAKCLDTLALHGYTGKALSAVVDGAVQGKEHMALAEGAAVRRGELAGAKRAREGDDGDQPPAKRPEQ